MPQNSRTRNVRAQPSRERQEVYVVQNWKDYLGESLMIVFSVFLALFFTEFINNQHEKSETRELIHNISTELIKNKQFTTEQYVYEQKVLKTIDTALTHPEVQQKIVANDEFHLNYIAPQGVLYRYLDNTAWDIAKAHNILSKLNFREASLLTRIYDEQTRIMKIEDEVARVIFNPESRKPQNAHQTLVLIKDIYHAWAVDRAPGLIQQYTQAVEQLKEN